MKRKPLWRISVATRLEAEDAVTELLGDLLGQNAASYFDLEAQSSLVSVYLQQTERGSVTRSALPVQSDSKTVSISLRKDSAAAHRAALRGSASLRREIKAGLAHIKACGLDTGTGTIKIQRVRHEDWAESWKRHFKPIEIGQTLLIKPSWSRRRPKKNQQLVILDPGLSFGTGQHPTTSFCLEAVARHVKKEPAGSFLDIGTGSGILAIAAAKLNFQPVFAFDFDPEAVRIARANAKNNQVHKKIQLTRGDVTRLPLQPARQHDLVCANLISTLLLAEQNRIIAQLKSGGTLVLAGILKTEFPEVRRAFATAGLKLARTQSRNEWQSGAFVLTKKG